MKKYIIALIIVLTAMSIVLFGCKEETETDFEKYGNKTISIIEQYQTADMTAEEARDKLYQLKGTIAALDDSSRTQLLSASVGLSSAVLNNWIVDAEEVESCKQEIESIINE